MAIKTSEPDDGSLPDNGFGREEKDGSGVGQRMMISIIPNSRQRRDSLFFGHGISWPRMFTSRLLAGPF